MEQIKTRLSIIDVVSSYVKLERAGQNMRAKCPFHAERTPSFFVSPDRGTYHCFGCDKGGDMFSFIEEIEGIDFKGALKILAERAGVPLIYEKKDKSDTRDRLFALMETVTIFYASQLSDDVHTYLQKRGLSPHTITAFRIGWVGDGWSDVCEHLKVKGFSEKELLDAGIGKRGERGIADKFRNRIMFPITDSAGRVVAFSGRTFGEHAHPEAPKYLNSPETVLFKKSRILYGFDRAKATIRKHNFAILVEGQMDLLTSYEAGFPNTVAGSGTAFTEEHATLLKRITDNLVIGLDADEAGVKAASRAARMALASGLHVKVAPLPRGSDPADFILKEGKEAWRAVIRTSKDIITFLLDTIEERAKNQEQFRHHVESAVLPFVLNIQSPIDREHYVREIAHRLHVSEHAVWEAVAKVSTHTVAEHPREGQTKSSSSILPRRAEEAFAILLWQKHLSKPTIDPKKYGAELKEAVGALVFNELAALPHERLEALRFRAEQLYSVSERLQESAQSLVHALTRERLAEELQQITQKLAIAEDKEDEVLTEQLLAQSKVLTKHIAELAKGV